MRAVLAFSDQEPVRAGFSTVWEAITSENRNVHYFGSKDFEVSPDQYVNMAGKPAAMVGTSYQPRHPKPSERYFQETKEKQ